MFNFISIGRLSSDIMNGMHMIPHDVDLVVGVPRSGMLAGSIIALALNKPLVDLDGFLAGRTFATGSSRRQNYSESANDYKRALIVDDSSSSGNAIREVHRKINQAGPLKTDITICVIYAESRVVDGVDVVMEVVPQPRIFEWNIFHHHLMSRSLLDIDGVLCHDPSTDQNDDGVNYRRFLLDAKLRVRPSFEIMGLVTSRLEKYRAETTRWMEANGIQFKELHMLDLPSAEERRRLSAHGSFKGEVYKRSSAELFIESESLQARVIASISGKPVLSLEDMEVYTPGLVSLRGAVERTKRSKGLKKFARSLLGKPLRGFKLNRAETERLP